MLLVFSLDVLLAIEVWWIYQLDLHKLRNQETCSKAVEKSRPHAVSVVLVCRRLWGPAVFWFCPGWLLFSLQQGGHCGFHGGRMATAVAFQTWREKSQQAHLLVVWQAQILKTILFIFWLELGYGSSLPTWKWVFSTRHVIVPSAARKEG